MLNYQRVTVPSIGLVLVPDTSSCEINLRDQCRQVRDEREELRLGEFPELELHNWHMIAIYITILMVVETC